MVFRRGGCVEKVVSFICGTKVVSVFTFIIGREVLVREFSRSVKMEVCIIFT